MINTRNRYTDDSGVANLTYTLGPAAVNEFNFALHHDTNRTFPFSQADVDKLSRSKNGLTLGQFYPNLNVLDMIPWASFTGIQNSAAFSTDSRFPTQSTDAIFDFSDNFTRIFNRHTVKTGVYFERVRYFSGGRGTNFGSFDFRSDTNNPLNTGYAYSNALLGVFYSYQESNTRVETNGRGIPSNGFYRIVGAPAAGSRSNTAHASPGTRPTPIRRIRPRASCPICSIPDRPPASTIPR
jgi:hypothetical protein